MKVSEEMEKRVEEEKAKENETPTAKNDFAKKWFIACIVLFIILIILAIVLQFVKTGEMWPDVPMTSN